MKKKIFKYYKFLVLASVLLAGICTLLLYQNTVAITYDGNGSGESKIYYTTEFGEGFSEEKTQNVEIEVSPTEPLTVKYSIWNEMLLGLRIDISGIEEIQLSKVDICKLGRVVQTYSAQEIKDQFTIINDVSLEMKDSALVMRSIGEDSFIGTDNLKLDNMIFKRISKIYLIIWILYFLWRGGKKIASMDTKKLLIFFFCGILVFPTIIARLTNYESSESLENTIIKEAPKLSLSSLEVFPTEYESYYEDTVPYKQNFVSLSGYINYYLFNKSNVSKVIKGKEDWLFLDETVSDFEGDDHYTEEELIGVAENLTDIKNTLEKDGVDFYVMIAPNKNTIYGEYMPNKYIQGETSKTEQLVKYIQENTDVNIIFPVEEILENKENLLYHKWDTHWNARGAYIGFNALAKEMGLKEVDEYKDVLFEEQNIPFGDLQNMLKIKLLGNDMTYNVNYKPEVLVNDLFDNSNGSYIGYQSNSENTDKLLVFRDSFTSALIPYLSKNFKESVYIWESFSWEKVEQETPDVVVYEMVERYAPRLKK